MCRRACAADIREDPKNTGDGTNINYLLNYSIGGVNIEAMFGESTATNYTSFDDMQLFTEDNWTGSLMYKLGFVGSPTNIYDY